MALTPDDIAQKAFTPRFRGIDPVEVREFLLLAAAQITELHELIRQQKEQIGEQEKELALAADDKKSFEDVLDVFRQKIDTLTAQLGETRKQQADREEEFERQKQLLEGVELERDNLKGELGRAQTSRSEADVLKQKIDTLTAQLGETRKQQADRKEEFERQKQLLEGVELERDNLKGELGRAQTTRSEADVLKQKIDTLTAQLGETRKQQADREEEFERVKQLLEGVELERDNLKGELGRAQTSLSEAESKSRMSRAAIEGLRNKVMVIEAEKAELINAAEQHQRIMDEARHQSDELTEETKIQAESMITEAKEEIARLRDAASQEMVVIREDIDKLNAQRRQLHADLRDLLHNHLDRLSEYATGTTGPTKSEYDDLFQKIDFTELEEFEEDSASVESPGNEHVTEGQPGESKETLRTKLKDGGIAYLSDE